MPRTRAIWACLGAVSLLCGCGFRAGGGSGFAGADFSPAGPVLVGSFEVRANPKGERISFVPLRFYGEHELRPDIYLKNDPSDPPDWDSKNKVLAGSVILHSNRPRALYKVRVLFKRSTLTGVDPSNADGITSSPYPSGYKFWNYGTIASGSGKSVRWELSVPSETPFDFVVEVWANEWRGQTPSSNNLNGIYAFSAQDIWVCGDGDTLLHTTDGGQTWATYHSNASPTPNFNAIWLTAPANLKGFAVCYQRIFWVYTYPFDWRVKLGMISGNITYYDIHFSSSTTGWVVGYNDDINKGEIRKTTDGGGIWSNAINPTSSALYGVWFISDTEGWVVGSAGTILHTEDGGDSWSTQSSGTGETLYDVHMLDSTDGWAVGARGTILHWDGSQWTSKSPTGLTATLKAVWFVSSREGWVVGDNGTVLHTTDGGNTWESQEVPTTNKLNALFFLNHAQGWAVGDGGIFLAF